MDKKNAVIENLKAQAKARFDALKTACPKVFRRPGWLALTLLIVFFVGASGLALTSTIVYWHYSRDLPRIITVDDYHPALVTRVIATGPRSPSDSSTAAQGGGKGNGVAPPPGGQVASSSPVAQETVIGEFSKYRRFVLPYDKIPPIVVQAFTSAEDDKFFEHSGINVWSIIRAAIANFRAGHVVQGGSTITQQVAKSLLGAHPERTIARKVKELLLTRRIEQVLTKQQILYLYLNEIYLGANSYGVEAACETYFRHPLSQITIGEAAILAGMPQAPGKYSPLLNPRKAKERQVYVLSRLKANGYITEKQRADAANTPLRVFRIEETASKYSPYLVEYLRKYLIEKYGEKAVYEGGMTIYTPTTPELSIAARQSVRQGLEAIDKRNGYRGALQHLNTREETQSYLAELREKIIDDRLECKVLLPDGRLDAPSCVEASGFHSESELLDPQESYQAVVTRVDDIGRQVDVVAGRIRGVIPFSKMSWARPARDEKNPQWKPDPTLPSQVVSVGDVVLVKPILQKGAPVAESVTFELSQEPQVQGALLSIEAKTGYVLAMQGGYDFDKSEFNRAVQAQRQPGSSFKPIIYASALEKGYTPASIIVDSPIVYSDADQVKWKPSNFEEKFYGDTTFRQALIKSRNVPTIKIVQNVQVPYVINYARRLGLNATIPDDLSISLGSASMSLLENTKLYALFPRLGRKVEPIFWTRITDRDGKVLEEQMPQGLPATPKISTQAAPAPSAAPVAASIEDPEAAQAAQAIAQAKDAELGRHVVNLPLYPPTDDPAQVLDPRVAYVMSHLMKEVVAYGTGHEASALGRPAAGKTGTTNDTIDAWFMGFTPNIVTGVWVGYDNHRSIGPNETGARAALPIWLGYMTDAVRPYPAEDFQVPPGIVFASIDKDSGRLAPPNSMKAIQEAFIEGTQPTENSDQPSAGNGSSEDFFKADQE